MDIGLGKSKTLSRSIGPDLSSSGNCHYDSAPFWTLPYAKIIPSVWLPRKLREIWTNYQPFELCYAKISCVKINTEGKLGFVINGFAKHMIWYA